MRSSTCVPRRLRRTPLHVACLVGFPALALLASSAQALTYTVNSNTDPATGNSANCAAGSANPCTLRDAVAAADAATGSSTIDFAPSVTLITVGGAGAFVLSNTTSGSVVTVDGGGSVTLDGNHASRIFTISANTKAAITGLTIQNGQAPANQNGGAIYASAAYDPAGALTIINTTLSGNTAYSGGAISGSVALTIAHSTVSGNTSSGGAGGGIYKKGGTLIIIDSTISGNYSHGAGGGVHDALYFGTPLTMSGSTVSGNTSRYNGGGVETDGGTITNSTIANNMSKDTNGGGFFNFGQLVLQNCTLSGNTDHIGGNNGLVSSGGASVEFSNTIISDGCAGAGLVIDNGGNLDSGTSCGFTAATSKSNATLNLGALTNNGGPTKTMLPSAGSKAINFTVCTNAPLNDQRDYLRPDPASVGLATPCDAGAVEVGSVPSDRIFAEGFGPPPTYK